MSQQENIYYFNVAKEGSTEENPEYERVAVPESQLTDEQKDLVLGNCIRTYDNMPETVKIKFLQYLVASREKTDVKEEVKAEEETKTEDKTV